MDAVEAATALDASVGWISGNGDGPRRVAGYLPEAAARQLFANQRTFLVLATGAVGRAIPVEGGYRVTGRWRCANGAAVTRSACSASSTSRQSCWRSGA
jgi:hypothetical protein